MQQGAIHGQAADANAQHQDAHVLDAGIRQQPLDVALPDHEDGSDGHRQQSHADHEPASEIRFGTGMAYLIDAQNRQKGTTGNAACEQRAYQPRRFPIGVGFPGVHGGQTHLGAVTDEQQHGRRVQPGR